MNEIAIEIYGRIVTTHGWAYVLTVLSPAGADKIREVIGEPKGVIAHYGTGELPQYQEQRTGSLDTIIEIHRIQVLEGENWRKKKAELGEAAYLK